MLYRLVQCMREGLEPDIDVYDAASWSAVAGLSLFFARMSTSACALSPVIVAFVTVMVMLFTFRPFTQYA